MTLQVLTARIGFNDPDVLDITRKSGREGLVFAPSWEILRPALRNMKDASEMIGFARNHLDAWNGESLKRRAWWRYVSEYLSEMRASHRNHRQTWDALLARPRVVLVCYCTDPEHCHRTLLGAAILPRLGAEYVGELDAVTVEAMRESEVVP